MDASHSRRRGYISLLVISYSYVFGLASNLNISNDARGSKIEITNSRSSSTDYGTDMGKQYIMCTESNLQDPWVLSCKESKDVVTRINFADYGNPSGKCEHYRHGNCGAKATMHVVKECLPVKSNDWRTCKCRRNEPKRPGADHLLTPKPQATQIIQWSSMGYEAAYSCEYRHLGSNPGHWGINILASLGTDD
ncbi:hypothetical protein YC2023_044776 [Brassica napus]